MNFLFYLPASHSRIQGCSLGVFGGLCIWAVLWNLYCPHFFNKPVCNFFFYLVLTSKLLYWIDILCFCFSRNMYHLKNVLDIVLFYFSWNLGNWRKKVIILQFLNKARVKVCFKERVITAEPQDWGLAGLWVKVGESFQLAEVTFKG